MRVARVDFHDHVVLIDRAVDHRHLTLAESVVQRAVDLRRGDAEPRSGVAIDDEIGFEALLLLIGVDVGEHGAVLECGNQLRRPVEQVVGAVGLQRVLVCRVALPAAGADILDRVQEQAAAGHLGKLRPQPGDDLIDRRPLRDRL